MKPCEAEAELRAIVYGFCRSQCVYVAAKLGIADYLEDGPRPYAELAGLTGAHPAALRRLLRAAASIGIVSEVEGGCVALAPLGELLRSDADGSMRAEVLHMLHPSSWSPWGQLLQSVKTGQPAFPEVFGQCAWAYRSGHPDIGAIFDAMASEMSKREADAISEHLDLSNVQQVVDVGGGEGGVIAGILSSWPDVRGVLFDQPHVIAGSDQVLRAAGVADRCRIASGDFFVEVPPDGDLYLLKAVIHNWDDDAAIRILKNCRQRMSVRARIVIVESVLDADESALASLMDLHMLVIHGGRQRTRTELEALLSASGFCLRGVTATTAGISLIEGTPT